MLHRTPVLRASILEFMKGVIPHGGVTSTNFNTASSSLGAVPEGTDPAIVADYQPFIDKTLNSFKNMVAARSISSENVAEVIFSAAIDGTDQLQYLVGNDTRGFIKARYESRIDQEYFDHIRLFFKY